jgi:hypothetical protein
MQFFCGTKFLQECGPVFLKRITVQFTAELEFAEFSVFICKREGGARDCALQVGRP